MKEDKYVLVTGAGSGLGKELATAFLDRGHKVVLVGRTKEKLLHYKERFDEDRALAIEADVAIQEQVERIFTESNRWGNQPHIVISCAGEGVFGEVGTFSQEDVQRVLAGSLIGTILVSQRAFVEMKDQGGFIVNVMSTAATMGRAQESIYCAAKWGARGFTESLRLEAKKTPVKIVSVYPGGMKTPFWSERAGLQPNTSSFMEPSEVADAIVDNLLGKSSLYVSDLVVNRI
jgi:short-subunit dehydrogenase